MNEDEKLIPDLKEWRELNGNDFSIDDWTSMEGNIKLSIGYLSLFWTDFIEYDDCVLFKKHFSIDNFLHWSNAESVEYFAQIESVINHIHIIDLFSDENKRKEISVDQIKYIGNKMCEIYLVKLKSDFPDRQFIIRFNGDENLGNLSDYQLTFYQTTNENIKLNKKIE